MYYRVLADIVVFVHLLWIVFLAAGAYWGARHRPIMVVHGTGLVFSIAMQIFGWYCPLTYLEVWLRGKQDAGQVYPGSFIAHYAEKIVYIEVTGKMIFILTIVLVAVNGWIYWRAFKNKNKEA